MQRWTRIAVQVWAIIGILLLVGAFGWLVGKVFSALVPFLIGLLIVLLLRRPVEWLERKGLNRTVAVLVCYLSAAVAFTVLLPFIVPPIYAQVAVVRQRRCPTTRARPTGCGTRSSCTRGPAPRSPRGSRTARSRCATRSSPGPDSGPPRSRRAR